MPPLVSYPKHITELHRYLSHIDSNGCWIPRNRPSKSGYVIVRIDGVAYLLHRLAISLKWNRPYNDFTFESRHICRNKLCFNPDTQHVMPGSSSDNELDKVRDGVHPNANKETCPRGHKLEPVSYPSRTYRRCFICNAERSKQYRLRKKRM